MFRFEADRTRLALATLATLVGSIITPSAVAQTPSWIWSPDHEVGNVPETACYFRKTFDIDKWDSAEVKIGADDSFEVFVNGIRVGRGEGWKNKVSFDIASKLRQGSNVVAVRVQNKVSGTAGLLATISIENEEKETRIVSDESWKTSLRPLPTWFLRRASERTWVAATNLGPIGTTSPWIEDVAFTDNLSEPKKISVFSNDITPEGSRSVLSQSKLQRERRPATIVNKTVPEKTVDAPTLTKTLELKTSKETTTIKEKAIPAGEIPAVKFRVANEFKVQHIAPHSVTGSLIAMTFDEHGQIIASRENGPLILVYDSDENGTFDRVREYCTEVKNCQGILALSGDVYVIADGKDGVALYALSDKDRDGVLEDVKTIVTFQQKVAEHGPHGLTLGPDGMLYVMLGNHTKVTGKFANTSPVKNYYGGDLVQPRWQDPGGHATGIQAPAGSVIRTDVNGSKIELVASGLRNPYDLAFNAQGDLFTHDADMESDQGTTWYRPTRVNHVVPGSEFGWRSGWAKWPKYFLDSLPGIVETGRGSPAGLVCYDHTQYPVAFHGALFTCDWSEGRILAIRMKQQGASYRASALAFVEGEPLGATDIDVGPDGNLYFTTGGRDTKGSIYRIVWTGEVPPHMTSRGKGIDAALRQPQLQSAWARQAIAQVQYDLGEAWGRELIDAYYSEVVSPEQRAKALQVMQWFGPQPSVDLLINASQSPHPALRQKAAELMSLQSDELLEERLIELLADSNVPVRRRACESLARLNATVNVKSLRKLLISEDRYESWAARRLLEQQRPEKWESYILASDHQRLFLNGATALMIAHPSKLRAQRVVARAMDFMAGFVNDRNFVDMMRVMQLAFIRGKLNPNEMPEVAAILAEEFPSSDHTINRELMRLLTFLQVDTIIPRYLSQLESDLPVEDQTHLAIHLSRIKTNWTPENRLRLYRFLEPTDDMGNSVPGYLQNAARVFGGTLNARELDAMLTAGAEYPSAAMAAVLKLPRPLSDANRQKLIQLDRQVANEEGEAMRRLKIAILAMLANSNDEGSMAYLREVFDRDPQRRVEVSLGLAESPGGQNWSYLVRSLPALDAPSSRIVMQKLRKVARKPSDAEPYRQVILTGMKLKDEGADEAVALLEHWNEYAPSGGQIEWEKALKAWQNWFKKKYPDAIAPELTINSNGGKWDYQNLLEHISGEAGRRASVERGELVYSKAKCASCHRAGSIGDSMGPDLTTISKRFLKQEILDSIMHPSKTISDQYIAKTVITDSGKSYNGIVGNGLSGEIVVLQSDGTKVRLPQSEVDEIIPSKVSAMPEGLLDELSLQEITDLFAFLGSPRKDRVVSKPQNSTNK